MTNAAEQAAPATGGLRRRTQQAAVAGEQQEGAGAADPFYGKAVDLESEPRRADPTDDGAKLAAAVGTSMLDAGFRMDWEAVAKEASSREPGAAVEVSGEGDVDVDKSLMSRGVDGLTSMSHWPFCSWDATTYVYVRGLVVVVEFGGMV